ncbi:MAG: FAD:protein FMN transferase [Candidatus Krumholzibacteriia bacterium]
MSAGHADNRLDSWRTGVLVLVVALLAGFATARWLNRPAAEAESVSVSRPLMGTLVTVSVPVGDRESGARVQRALDEVARVDSLFSWRLPPPEQTPPAERERERLAVLELGRQVQVESDGAFDPRLRPLVDAWGFDGGEPAIPPAAVVDDLVAGLRELGRPRDAAELESRPGILHFGAWAKGYAVDRAVAVLEQAGQPAALVTAGGEVRGYGRRWTVGVQDPRIPGALVARLAPGTLAVATSGDYEQYFEQDGVRYHHLLDPRTGRPAMGCRSVTVLAPTCARADALATAAFVLGPRAGMDLIERLADVEGLIIDAAGKRHDSSGLAAYLADR